MKHENLPVIRKTATIVLIVYTLLFGLSTYISPKINSFAMLAGSDFFTIAGELISIAILLLALRCHPKEYRLPWNVFLIGLAANLAADLIWSCYDIVLQIPVPSASAADMIYLLSNLLYMAAFLMLLRYENRFSVIRTGLDVLITVAASTTVIFHYVLYPIWKTSEMTLAEKFFSLAYPVIDLAYLAGIVSFFFLLNFHRRVRRRNLILCAAFVLWFIADQIYAVDLPVNYVSGAWIDPLWPIGCILISIAALYPDSRVENDIHLPWEDFQRKGYYLFLFVPYIITAFILVLVSYHYIFHDALITGALITTLLIICRQLLSLIENRRLMEMLHETNEMLANSQEELKKQNQELKEMHEQKVLEANTDFLTGLYNRRYLNGLIRSFTNIIDLGRNDPLHDLQEMEVSVLLADIDFFKVINDTFGHDAGDYALQKVADIIRSNVRTADIAGRFGGDEFVIIMHGTTLSFAENVAERLLESTRETDTSRYFQSHPLSLSIGCSHWKGPRESFPLKELIHCSDQALYKAKSRGRGCCMAQELIL